jgi:hypothetical protein
MACRYSFRNNFSGVPHANAVFRMVQGAFDEIAAL